MQDKSFTESNFPEQFRKLRKQKSWSQEELAHALGVTRGYIGLIETGKREPSDRTFRDFLSLAENNAAPVSNPMVIKELACEDSGDSYGNARMLVRRLLGADGVNAIDRIAEKSDLPFEVIVRERLKGLLRGDISFEVVEKSETE